MPSLEYDMAYVNACASELEDYILSSVLFWPLGARPPKGGPPFPRLTLGGMSLARMRISARASIADSGPGIEDAGREVERLRLRWEANWERKAAWEFSARVREWENFLRDFRVGAETGTQEYSQNVYRRAILELLMPEMGEGGASDRAALAGLDRRLRSTWVDGDFRWDEELSPGFPKDPFWFLHGAPATAGSSPG